MINCSSRSIVMFKRFFTSKTSSKYLIAIQLVNKQRTLLQEVLKIRPDKAIEQDIELLSKYYQILYEQAKVMNLIN